MNWSKIICYAIGIVIIQCF